MTGVFLGLVVYLVLQLALGFWVGRRVHTRTDYLLAGRKLGPVMSTFSIFATWFGAETCIGAAGAAYAGGLAAVTSEPFGYVLALVLFGLVVAVPLWRTRATTLADLYRDRWGPIAEKVAVLLLVPSSVLWAAAQIRAFGQVVGHVADVDLDLAISGAALVVILYTAAGGLLADAWTDLIQGIVLIVGLVILVVVMATSGEMASLAALPPELLTLTTPEATWLSTLEQWGPPVLGSLVAQELAQRAMAARTPRVARTSTLVAAFTYLLVGLLPILVGLAAIGVLPGLEDPEQALLAVADRHLSTFLYVIFAGALVSAILSTVDTALLVSGGLLSQNVIVPLRPTMSERQALLAARVSVVALGVVAWALAFGSESVYDIVEEATALGSTGALVAFVFIWWPRLGGQGAAVAAMIAGPVWHAVDGRAELTGHPWITSLALALFVYLVVALTISRPRPPHMVKSLDQPGDAPASS
ncbi:MAG: sodium:solute symporter family protein [Deltaproteobacteria bacterium]|nr:sodium:solute symporter family protein [Deltaproteobacteria bacterium]